MRKVIFKTLILFFITMLLPGTLASIAYARDVNLALGKKATQSSVEYGGDPQRAVDGNTDGNYSSNSVTHTNRSLQEWWQVDLGSVQDISKIRIWNRTDCCAERLSNFYVLVSDVPFHSQNLHNAIHQPGVWNSYYQDAVGRPAQISVKRSGRFVRIQLAGTDYLSLAEVEIIAGSAVRKTHLTAMNNLALGKKATQSSVGYDGDSQRAVDGNTDGNYSSNSVTHTNNSPQEWWQVDLGSVQNIRKIRIWNRTDCCGERLSNFYVLVSDVPLHSTNLQTTLNQPGVWNSYYKGVAGRPTQIPVKRFGRFVRIQLMGTDFLSLAEVEVVGYPDP